MAWLRGGESLGLVTSHARGQAGTALYCIEWGGRDGEIGDLRFFSEKD